MEDVQGINFCGHGFTDLCSGGDAQNYKSGILLEEYCPINEYPKVPALVIHCVRRLERFGAECEGLYRVNGNKQEINGTHICS